MAQFIFKGRAPSTHLTVGWVGPTAVPHKGENPYLSGTKPIQQQYVKRQAAF
jgi:hypothetical protein